MTLDHALNSGLPKRKREKKRNSVKYNYAETFVSDSPLKSSR